MKVKKICAYLPATLVPGKSRWYIKYYQTNPTTGKLERFRPTYNLNRIKCRKERRKVAADIIQQINTLLPEGFPYSTSGPAYTKVGAAILWAYEHKVEQVGKSTFKQYRQLKESLLGYVEAKELGELYISHFSPFHASQFMKYLLSTRNIGNRSYNNFLRDAIILFNVLAKFEYIEKGKNPFLELNKKQVEPVNYRKLTEGEQHVIYPYIRENDNWLWKAVLLIRYCGMRPIELTRLRFYHFNLMKGTIKLAGDVVKKSKARYATMPKKMQPFFVNPEFAKYPANYFVFGKQQVPGPEPIAEGNMRKRFKKIVRLLKEEGKIKEVDRLKFYSNKRNMISSALQHMNPNSVIDQTGHASFSVLLGYKDKDEVNVDMLNFDDGFL